ncbi:hypothetical protein D3C87_1149750 [compost metagenome]
MPGAQHGLLIGDSGFLLLRFTQLEHATQAASVEQRQAELRADAERTRSPGAEIAQLHGLGTDVPRQGDSRIEIALGHANAGSGGMQPCFGLANVRPTFSQLRGQADGDLTRRLWHRCVCG